MMQPVPRYDSYSVGAYSRTVCVYRRKPGGPYHCEIGTERAAARPTSEDELDELVAPLTPTRGTV